MGFISLCIVMNENLILFSYNEIIKYEIGGTIIDLFNNLLSPNENILSPYNGLWRIKPPIRDMIEVKEHIVIFILLITNLMNVGIGAIIFEKLEIKDNK